MIRSAGLGPYDKPHRSGSKFFVAWVRLGQPFMVWVWIWKISPKNVKIFNFLPFGSKKISSGRVRKYPGQPLIYCGSKESSGWVRAHLYTQPFTYPYTFTIPHLLSKPNFHIINCIIKLFLAVFKVLLAELTVKCVLLFMMGIFVSVATRGQRLPGGAGVQANNLLIHSQLLSMRNLYNPYRPLTLIHILLHRLLPIHCLLLTLSHSSLLLSYPVYRHIYAWRIGLGMGLSTGSDLSSVRPIHNDITSLTRNTTRALLS